MDKQTSQMSSLKSLLKINYGMIPVKISYMGYQIGKRQILIEWLNHKGHFVSFQKALGMSLPFLSLQMIAIGLTVEDISFVYGLLPVLSIGGIAAIGEFQATNSF